MADPTTPPVSADTTNAVNSQTDAFGRLTTATDAQTHSYRSLETVSELVQRGIQGIEDAATSAGVSLNNLDTLTQQQTEQFTLAANAAVNAREAFAGFANVDYSGLSTFTDQMKDIKEALDNTPATKAAGALKTVADSIGKLTGDQVGANAALAKGKEAFLDYAANILKHADNMARAQTAVVQMAGRTGELGDVMNAAGKDMMNVNDILEKQQELLKDTREATGLSAKQAEQWYNQLGLIPGALNSVTDLTDKSGKSTSMLTAVIEAATGSGREQADVMKDLNVAFQTYGLVGEKALLFSTRMSDVSARLKAPIDNVTSALRGSADAFKFFVTGQENASKSAESLADTLNTYGKALESTGLSATQAVEIAGGLSTQVAKLSTAQLSFISQRTGGAGGLQGAAQETLKLQTDPGAVVRDAMNTLRQQFGKIVTIQEAATSQAAASQNVKQTLLLQQLLGPLAKDQASANRLLEAMKNTSEGHPDAIAKALAPTSVQDAAQKGVEIQSKTYGVTTEIRNLLESIRDITDRGAGGMSDKLTAAGTNQDLTLFQGQLKSSLKDAMQAGRERGGSQVAETARGLATGAVSRTGGADAAADIHRTLLSLKDIPIALKAHYQILSQAFASKDSDTAKAEEDTLQQMITSQKQLAEYLKGNPAEQNKALSTASGAQVLLDATKAIVPVQESASSRVGTAAHTAASRTITPPTATTATQAVGLSGQYAAPGTLNVVGNIHIDCPHCGRPNNVSDQFKITTGPAGQTK